MTENLLEVRNLAKHYAGVVALADVSFDVGVGEILAILGPNGSGKTTLFNVISGFASPTSGSVSFLGRGIGNLKPTELVKFGIARSFQESMCFSSFTVRENLNVAPQGGRSRGDRANVDELLEVCGLSAVADLPSRSLPYGIQRKLGVAIALSTSPKLVLLDEPGAGLSEADFEELSAVIRVLPDRDVSVVCIDHNLPFLLPIAQRVVVLDAGTKIFDGSPQGVRESRAVIQAYLGSGHG